MLASLFALLPLLALTSATPIVKRVDNSLIESYRNPGQCLSVQGGLDAVAAGNVNNNTPVITTDCLTASRWNINRGSGSITVSGLNFALDIGLNPGNNGGLKVYQSYPGAPQQTWYFTDDNRIAITGGNQCLDAGSNGPQTYQCTTGNTNQIWYARNIEDINTSARPSATSSSAPAPTSSAPSGFLSSIPVTTGSDNVQDVAGNGRRIRVIGREDLCLMVAGGFAGVGAPVAIVECNTDIFAELQLWDLPNTGSTGQVKLHNSSNGQDYCLDAGSNPANGVGAKIWPCGGYPQQLWTFDGVSLKTANNQCLDIQSESTPTQAKPYVTYRNVQTWSCSSSDPFQGFKVQA